MGITGVSVEEYESRLGVKLSADKGVVIIEVQGDSPAGKAGIQSGDIITKIGDTEVSSMSQLKKALYKYKKDEIANISITRNAEVKNIEIEFTAVR